MMEKHTLRSDHVRSMYSSLLEFDLGIGVLRAAKIKHRCILMSVLWDVIHRMPREVAPAYWEGESDDWEDQDKPEDFVRLDNDPSVDLASYILVEETSPGVYEVALSARSAKLVRKSFAHAMRRMMAFEIPIRLNASQEVVDEMLEKFSVRRRSSSS